MMFGLSRVVSKVKANRVINLRYLKRFIVLVSVVIVTIYSLIDVWTNPGLASRDTDKNGSISVDYFADESNTLTTLQQPDDDELCDKLHLDDYLSLSKLPSTETQAIQFIPELRNPCWYEEYGQEEVNSIQANPYQYTVNGAEYVRKFHSNLSLIHSIYQDKLSKGISKRLRCVPYFYIIGQPKSGTTDLYKKLTFHPQIRRGLLKETHWWRWANTGITTLWLNHEVEFSHLVDLFSLASIDLENTVENQCKSDLENKCVQWIMGDGSAFTMDSAFDLLNKSVHSGFDLQTPKTIPQYIKWSVPSAKFIVVLREPVSRLYSGYAFFNKLKLTKGQWDFHYLVQKAIAMFTKCMKAYNDFGYCSVQQRLLTKEITLQHGFYSFYLEEWFKVFGREQFLVLKMEDYAANMRETLRKVYKFLDVCDLSPEVEDVIVSTRVYNSGKSKIGPMFEATHQLLRDFYRPFNERLAYIMNDSRFLWS